MTVLTWPQLLPWTLSKKSIKHLSVLLLTLNLDSWQLYPKKWEMQVLAWTCKSLDTWKCILIRPWNCLWFNFHNFNTALAFDPSEHSSYAHLFVNTTKDHCSKLIVLNSRFYVFGTYFARKLLKFWPNENMSMIKVIEDNLRHLLKRFSFHDTVWTMLQLDAAGVLTTFAPFFLS